MTTLNTYSQAVELIYSIVLECDLDLYGGLSCQLWHGDADILGIVHTQGTVNSNLTESGLRDALLKDERFRAIETVQTIDGECDTLIKVFA